MFLQYNSNRTHVEICKSKYETSTIEYVDFRMFRISSCSANVNFRNENEQNKLDKMALPTVYCTQIKYHISLSKYDKCVFQYPTSGLWLLDDTLLIPVYSNNFLQELS